jgi:hypothetical protein
VQAGVATAIGLKIALWRLTFHKQTTPTKLPGRNGREFVTLGCGN